MLLPLTNRADVVRSLVAPRVVALLQTEKVIVGALPSNDLVPRSTTIDFIGFLGCPGLVGPTFGP